MKCSTDGKPGWKFGASGACYTYTPGNDASEKAAKVKAVKQGLAIGGGKPPPEGFGEDAKGLVARAVREYKAEEETPLPTEDIVGIEVFAAGGPYHGTGSPPEGDFYNDTDIEQLAADSERFADRVKAPLKLGHGDAQGLLAAGFEEDEEPRSGTLTNFRAEAGKILADAKHVPAKLAQLVKAGRYPRVSVELSNHTDDDGEKHRVVSALALLGAKAPAVKTLDDLIAQHADDDLDPIVAYSFRLDTTSYTEPTLTWTEPLTDDSEVPDDTSSEMGNTATETGFTEAQIESFAAGFGIEEDDAEKRREAVMAKFAEIAPQADPEPDPEPEPPKPDEPAATETTEGAQPVSFSELELLKAKAERGDRAYEQLVTDRIERKVQAGVEAGKIDPATADNWRRDFRENEEMTDRHLAEMPVNDEYLVVYGHGGEGATQQDEEERMYAAWMAQQGKEV